MSFTPTTWVNGAAPGISAEQLNRIEQGIVTQLANNVSAMIISTRDMSLTGVQTITTSANKTIKSIQCIAVVLGTFKSSIGFWSTSNNCNYTYGNDGKHDLSGRIICISDLSVTNRTLGNVQNVTLNSFDIDWTIVGTGATGTTDITFLINYC